MDNEKIVKRPIPKQAFDSEYMTEFQREVRFLAEKGIKYVFVKKTQEYGISQYKYKKTPALFAALVEFYATIEAEKAAKYQKGGVVRNQVREIPAGEVIISPKDVLKAQEILEKAVEQGVIKTGIDVTDLETKEVNITIEKDDTV